MSVPRIIAVTGGNKGLGKSIVKLLLQDKEDKLVYLTSRNVERGKNAVKELETLGLSPLYHPLDITDLKSIETFRDHLVEKHGGIDALVNNAGIAYKLNSPVPFSEQASGTINNDFFGTYHMCNTLFPVLKRNARVVNVSAQTVERVYAKLSQELKTKFSDTNLSMEGLHRLMLQFINDTECGKLEENGWPQHAYGMAKIGINFMTFIQQRECDTSYPDQNIIVNCCCPGTVDTDMTGGKYPHAIPPDVAADTPVYLACLPNGTDVKGRFVIKRAVTTFPQK